MRSFFVASCTLVLLASFKMLVTGKENKKTAPPNIVFILADDLGYGDLGCYGQKKIFTPHLNRMAAEGMRFTQFYSGTSVCAPSRSALMTGQHTGHTPIRGNKEVKPEGQSPLPQSALTIAEVLKQKGYTTGDFGKWGLGFIGSTGDPVNQGFDRFYGYNCQRQSHNFYPDHLWSNTTRVELSNTPSVQTEYAPEMIQQQALAFIERNKQAPFFLYLSYTLPHAALQVPFDTLFEKYKKALNEKPVAIPAKWEGTGYQPQVYPRAAYATMVTRLDAYVGQVLATLKTLGLDDNTIVLFSSDNGPHKEGGHDPAYFNSTAGFKGIKRDLYEGGIRVPMIARWPGKIAAGKVNHYIGAFWDFLPTFAQMAGSSKALTTDGVSIVPTLLGKGKQPEHPYLYWEFHEEGGRQAVRMGKWKGVKTGVKNNKNAPLELYDLQTDPKEENNIAVNHPELVEKINQYIKEAHKENETFPLFN